MTPSDCRVVLVRPRDPNNIGAAARAMKNFGFSDLWIVTPHPPTWDEVTAAVNATDVLTNARVVSALAEALADCNLVIGTGDRTRAETEPQLYTPLELSGTLRAHSYQLALVFGSEKHGLTNAELSHCHRLLTIPTRPNCPSMNLGQAVAVCLYELVRQSAERPAPPPPAPTENAYARASEAAVQLALEVMQAADFVLPGNQASLTQRVRAGLMKYNLNAYDTQMLCGILRKIKGRMQPPEES
jgi:TrmH family RNA methyltransferase